MTLSDVASAFANKKLSPLEYVTDLLDRIARLDPEVHAFIDVRRDAMLAQAKAAGEALAKDGPRSPLHGIPVGIKDIIDVQGSVTTCHSAFFKDAAPARRDAAVVAQLRQAGAVIGGKLATHEFAIGGPSFDLPFPPAANPWRFGHNPGGSSSGSGAAVAARFLPAALGTDTGGSVRHPANHCGIVGLKPTFGLVDTAGVFPLSYTLDHVGPMTRTVRDNALLLGGMVPPRGGAVEDYTRLLDKGVKGVRIGVIRQFYEKDIEAHPDVRAAVESVVDTLARAGAVITTVTLPPLSEYYNAARLVLCTEAAAVHEQRLRERPQDFAALSRQRLLPGLLTSGVEYVQAQRRRQELADAIDALFGDVDVLVTASSMDPACPVDDEAAIAYTYGRQARLPFNASGHPALNVMCGLSREEGMPLGVQIVGPRRGEAKVYQVGAEYERLTDWTARLPSAVV